MPRSTSRSALAWACLVLGCGSEPRPGARADGGGAVEAARSTTTSATATSTSTPSGPTPTEVALTPRGPAVKIEQLIGDVDKHLHRPTSGRTLERYGVGGTDLGYAFEDGDRVVLLFGDTLGTEGQVGSDAVGFTRDRDPEDGVALEFYTRADGKYLPFRPRDAKGKEQRLMGFEVPVAGIRLGDEVLVAYKDGHTGDEDGSKDADAEPVEPTDVTSLARLDVASGGATTLCELSRQPRGRFQKLSLREPVDTTGLPEGGPWVLMHGTGRHRASHGYLALAPRASFASCTGLRYFARLDNGAPVWTAAEAEAEPVLRDGPGDGGIGELSVTWAAPVKSWLAVYDTKQVGSWRILLRHAATPWGPWSEPVTLLDGRRDAAGVYVHDPAHHPDDGQAGPKIGKDKDHPERARGTVYAPFVVERWTRLEGDTLRIYFTLSLWNPYVVLLMRADLAVH